MLDRFKRILVESFIGAIALGWMLAGIVTHLVNALAAPVASWIGRAEYRPVLNNTYDLPKGFLFQDAVPELIRFVVLFLVWYVLVRWLYFKPVQSAPSGTMQNSEPPA